MGNAIMGDDDSIYILNGGSEEVERNRLDIQHPFFHNVMDRQLLPAHLSAELSSNPSPKVIEIATGSGIWLKDLAEMLPESAELVGLDFDTSKFRKDLPPNIKLGFGDMYEPFPEEYHGRFDIVHVRFILYAARKGMGVWLAQNLLSLLRPGGWLVWADAGDFLGTFEPPSHAWFRFKEVSYAFATAIGRDLNIPIRIPSYLKEAGYADCDDKVYTTCGGLDESNKAEFCSLAQTLAKAFIKQGLNGILASGGVEGMRTQKEADDLLAQAEEELRGDTRFHIVVLRAWGRRPLSAT